MNASLGSPPLSGSLYPATPDEKRVFAIERSLVTFADIKYRKLESEKRHNSTNCPHQINWRCGSIC